MLRNSENSWGSLARALHWLTAAMIIGLFAYGLYMTQVPAREDRGFHYTIHASIGISLLTLMLLRVIWRFMNPTPLPPAGSSNLEIAAARFGHLGLYLLTFGAAIAGWLMAGSGRRELDYYLFGIIPMPNMLGTGSPYHEFLEEAHELLAYALIALVVAHVAAAIWHKKARNDGIVERMTSGEPSKTV